MLNFVQKRQIYCVYTSTVLRLLLRGKRTGNGVIKTLCKRDFSESKNRLASAFTIGNHLRSTVIYCLKMNNRFCGKSPFFYKISYYTIICIRGELWLVYRVQTVRAGRWSVINYQSIRKNGTKITVYKWQLIVS